MNTPPLIANRYELGDKLGQGGMGSVYRAYDRLSGQPIALKRVNTGIDRLQFATASPSGDLHLALALEFRTLAGLRHPNIISVLDYGFDAEGKPFFTMELLSGARPIHKAAEDQPLATQVQLLTEMLLALSYLHRRGVIHRDLKPGNVLVTPGGHVKVLDFGLASDATQAMLEAAPSATGTTAYMAPELFSDAPSSVQSDLYAVGVIAYEILLRVYPYPSASLSTLLQAILTQTPDTSRLDPALADWLDSLLTRDPANRPPNVDQVIHDLCAATHQPLPLESVVIRESFLQASKFVGREPELHQLKTSLHRVLNRTDDTQYVNRTEFVLIGGEAGVGKSRLVEELRIRALVHGALVLHGQGVAEGGLPFQLWQQPARRLALSTALTQIEAGILKELIPDLDTLLGCEISPAPEINGEARQQRMVFTLVELFKRQTQPIVLILEDIHWASEGSLSVLRQLIQVRGQLGRLMIAAPYRDDEKPNLPQLFPEMQVMRLKRFDEQAIAQLSESMLGEAGKRRAVVDLLQRETEGNAFFMVEVVRTLADDAGRLSDIGLVTLPAHIFTGGAAKVIRQRLNRLPDEVLTWLKPIAVAGRQLDLALIDQLNGGINHEYLTLCTNAAVLEVSDNAWRFSHDKIREALLEDLANDERQLLNQRVALAIEAVYPHDTRYDEVLLEHWHQAGNIDKEIMYLDQVAEHLIEIAAAHAQARSLLERGIERLPLGDVRRIGLLNLEARSYWRQGEYAQSQIAARKALTSAQAANDQRGLAASLSNLGVVASRQREYVTASEYYQQSFKIQQRLNDQHGIASSLNNLGILAFDQRNYPQARAYYQQSLALRRAIHDQQGVAATLNNLALIANDEGDFALASDYQQESLALSQASGSQLGIALSFAGLGYTYLQLKSDQAPQTFYQALKILYAIQVTPVMLSVLVGFVVILMQRGSLTRAAELAGLLKHHPARHTDLDKLLAQVLPALGAYLSVDDLDALMTRGKLQDLDTVVCDLLAEFAPSV